MEYEIEDETQLFDESTNPSLKRRHRVPPRALEPRERRRLQKGEFIPDEEEQAA